MGSVIAACIAALATIVIPGQANAGERIGDCEILLDHPHNSGHRPGTVDADMRIRCRTPQKYLGVESFLYRESVNPGHRWMVTGKPSKAENAKYVTSVAFEDCQNAKYQSKANFLIIDNAGVRHERFDVWSPVVDITCK
ncbi:hypothetical protein [Pseudonocardia zijingensis]|uniref:hypothetical protein n=1 Tax=Pseudonocardia zijingensis TaxID=153376 RepID=UPI0031D40BFF